MSSGPKYKYEIHLEPVCECLKCGNVHLRKDRIKHKVEDNSKILNIFLCPNCKNKAYLYYGDKEVKRRKKNNE